ncbi:MAG: ribonuclease P protein component [Phycisphaerae bacterium]|nr:ribonuclease P protein component [Phycisphaerae bacterium]
MLKKQLRFHGHGSLRYVYKNADTYRSRLLTLRIVPNFHRQEARVAVVVSKKTHKSAVGRNRMRRRVYELLRHELPHIAGTYDIVVIITSSEVLTANADDLKSTLHGLLGQASVYKESH